MTQRNRPAIAFDPSRVDCPRCKTRQPSFRWPANVRQFFFGGWTCERCDTEMDSFGRPVL